MKKTLAVILALSMAGCVLAGCQSTAKTEETEAAEEAAEEAAGEVAGGWTITEAAGTALSDEAAEAFEAAQEGYAGMGFEAITLMGTQVVAGVNYAILAKGTTVTATPQTALKVVIVYAGVDGERSIKTVADFSIGDYTEDKDTEEAGTLAGGWTVTDEDGFALPDDVQESFDNAMEGLVGVGYEPLAYLGSQVVAGVNYAVLCRATKVTAEPVSYLAVVSIYRDLEGGCSVNSIHAIDIAAYNE